MWAKTETLGATLCFPYYFRRLDGITYVSICTTLKCITVPGGIRIVKEKQDYDRLGWEKS